MIALAVGHSDGQYPKVFNMTPGYLEWICSASHLAVYYLSMPMSQINYVGPQVWPLKTKSCNGANFIISLAATDANFVIICSNRGCRPLLPPVMTKLASWWLFIFNRKEADFTVIFTHVNWEASHIKKPWKQTWARICLNLHIESCGEVYFRVVHLAVAFLPQIRQVQVFWPELPYIWAHRAATRKHSR